MSNQSDYEPLRLLTLVLTIRLSDLGPGSLLILRPNQNPQGWEKFSIFEAGAPSFLMLWMSKSPLTWTSESVPDFLTYSEVAVILHGYINGTKSNCAVPENNHTPPPTEHTFPLDPNPPYPAGRVALIFPR